MKILTFDIEDWFHILDHPSTTSVASWENFPSRLEPGVQKILKILSDHRVKATFFCLGWVGEKYPHVIKEIVDAGHDIGSHSYGHQLVYTQNRETFRYDLQKSMDILQSISGKKILAYRAPGFSITDQSSWAFNELVQSGIKIDCSVFAARRSHGGIPRLSEASKPFELYTESGMLKCFPLNTVKLFGPHFVFSGGGYFRLLPLWVTRRLFNRSDYVMTYFHPRDFDPRQPRLPDLSLGRTFKSYVGLARTEAKLREILAQNVFTTVSEIEKTVDWKNTLKISIRENQL